MEKIYGLKKVLALSLLLSAISQNAYTTVLEVTTNIDRQANNVNARLNNRPAPQKQRKSISNNNIQTQNNLQKKHQNNVTQKSPDIETIIQYVAALCYIAMLTIRKTKKRTTLPKLFGKKQQPSRRFLKKYFW